MTLKNTDNNAIISIENIQTSNDFQDKTELITEGKFYRSKNKIYILYKEDENDEFAGSSVIISVSEKEITMSRKGDFSSKMNYCEGETEQVIYYTPFGNTVMLLKTIKIDNFLSDNGGELKLTYDLSINGDEIHNNLVLKVKKEGSNSI